jgi:hypothetical protein
MTETKPKIPTLDDLGTRYQHYQELRELFAEGVEILNNALSYCKNKPDEERKASLQHAVNEISNRMEILSGFEGAMGRYGNIAKEINAIERQKLLTEGSDGSEESKKLEKSLPSCPNRDIPYSKGSTDIPDCV